MYIHVYCTCTYIIYKCTFIYNYMYNVYAKYMHVYMQGIIIEHVHVSPIITCIIMYMYIK